MAVSDVCVFLLVGWIGQVKRIWCVLNTFMGRPFTASLQRRIVRAVVALAPQLKSHALVPGALAVDPSSAGMAQKMVTG